MILQLIKPDHQALRRAGRDCIQSGSRVGCSSHQSGRRWRTASYRQRVFAVRLAADQHDKSTAFCGSLEALPDGVVSISPHIWRQRFLVGSRNPDRPVHAKVKWVSVADPPQRGHA